MRFCWAFIALVGWVCLGCGDDDTTTPDPDGGTVCPVPDIEWEHPSVSSVVGVARTTALHVVRDFCTDAVITLEISDPAVAAVPATVTIPFGSSRVEVQIDALAVGTATVTANLSAFSEERLATIEVAVTDAALPSCDGSATGNLAPGSEVVVASGSLAGGGIRLPAGAARDDQYNVDPLDVTVGCGPDQVPAGYAALGPAMSVGPAHARFRRDVPIILPLRLSLLPAGAHRGHIEVSYTGAGVAAPRIVPVAVKQLTGVGDELLTFEAPRLGTYQAVVRTGAGAARERELTFQALTGVSMGGIGSGLIGFRHPERFDFVAPLGAAWDWRYVTSYVRNHHLGGFCDDAEFRADTTGACNAASIDRVPEPRWIHEVKQDYEHWWYDDRARGQGTTWDREEYVQIFKDLSRMYGNMITDRVTTDAEPNITPPGIDDSERARPAAERCATPVVIPPTDGSPGTGFFDDEYNPDGSYPAITFCDGSDISVMGERDAGVWDPAGANPDPIEVALAIDRNGNGVRDAGEPVVRNFWEPYEDCGLDRLCNADEAGFDPVTNPDPAGDDFDPQYNPAGTEGNMQRDGDRCDVPGGEVFVDSGLDGVMGTPQLTDGGFDNGEGNGCHDITIGLRRMLDRGPLQLLQGADEGALRDLGIFLDGGIRDPLIAVQGANHTSSGLPFRGFPLRYLNGHSSFHLDGRPLDDEEFVFTGVNWSEAGRYLMVRYGDVDVGEGLFENGDGGHVGTSAQFVNRVLSVLAWMSAGWPGGDRRIVADRLCRTGMPGCDQPNQILVEFTSPTTGRTGPSVVILPPGYFQPENAELRYPVVYLMHGLGMEPNDLIDIAILIWNFMTAPNIPEARRFQKLIFVIPDGRCRNDECLSGTFYTDAPPGMPNGAQMETYMLDFMDYVTETFRTKAPETHSLID